MHKNHPYNQENLNHHKRLNTVTIFHLLKYNLEYHLFFFSLIGDFNAKTGDTQDYISKDEKLSQYLDVYDDSDFLDYMDDFYTLHKVDFPVGRYIIVVLQI
jgi:hypothetical protein